MRSPRRPPSTITSTCSLAFLLLWLMALVPTCLAAAAPSPPTEPLDEVTYRGHTLSQLDAMLQSPDPKERVAAIVSLRDAGAAAIPVFTWALNDEDPTVRIAAIKSLGPLGPPSEAATPALAELLLTDPIPAVRTQIIHTLGQMGPNATGALPALRRLQREADITTRVNVSQALDRILSGQC